MFSFSVVTYKTKQTKQKKKAVSYAISFVLSAQFATQYNLEDRVAMIPESREVSTDSF